MNARELIQALGAEGIDQERPVEIGAFNEEGEYYIATVVGVADMDYGLMLDSEPTEDFEIIR